MVKSYLVFVLHTLIYSCTQTHACTHVHTQDEERLKMIEQKRKMEEERRALEKAQRKAQKAQQDVILNRKGSNRPRLSFTITPKES